MRHSDVEYETDRPDLVRRDLPLPEDLLLFEPPLTTEDGPRVEGAGGEYEYDERYLDRELHAGHLAAAEEVLWPRTGAVHLDMCRLYR